VSTMNNREEIAASVAAQQTLGPGYDQALAEGLVERIGEEIDNRIAARIDQYLSADADAGQLADGQFDHHVGCRHVRRAQRRAERAARRAERANRPVLLTIGSLAAAVAASMVVLLGGAGQTSTPNGVIRTGPGGSAYLLTAVIWITIAVINVAYAKRDSR
jgi:hypothetical protein